VAKRRKVFEHFPKKLINHYQIKVIFAKGILCAGESKLFKLYVIYFIIMNDSSKHYKITLLGCFGDGKRGKDFVLMTALK
jgi:hypothetical protein